MRVPSIRKLLESLPEDQKSLSWCILISCFTGPRQSEKDDLRPLVAAVEAIDYREVVLPDWLGEKRYKRG